MSVSVSVSDAWNSSFSNADNSVCNNVDELYPRANDHTSHNIVHQHATGCFTSIITSSNILVTLYGPTYNMTSGAVCAVWTPQFSKYCNGVFSRISPDILNRFSQFFSPYESALGADEGSVSYFRFVKGRCHINQIISGETRK